MIAAEREAQHKHDRGGLAVIVDCGHFMCAIPSDLIVRLMLLEDMFVEVEPAPGGSAPSVVFVGNERYAGFDLGSLLGVKVPPAAWILLGLNHDDRSVPVALRVGRCLAVQRIGRVISLPSAAFRARGGAFAGAFTASALKLTSSKATFGVWVEPSRVVGPSMLHLAVEALRKRVEP